jgi:hypothetical protein
LGTNRLCQRCQGTLSPGSAVEWSLLPDDTAVIKKLYEQPDRPPLVASIVLSGADRTSIHRPQICLVGGGQEIVATHARSITLPDGRVVRVTVLDLLWRGQAKDGRTVSRERYFAYWFVGPHHETASPLGAHVLDGHGTHPGRGDPSLGLRKHFRTARRTGT